MSEIPYLFDLPPPKYFRENGWYTNSNMSVFIHWAFARCSLDKRIVFHIQKAIELEPFEFIFGRRICSEETGLSEREIRTCIDQLNATPIGEILKKSTSKTTNKFTVYRWVTSHFSKNINQLNDQQTTSRRPADDHNQDDKKDRYKNDHQPNPSSKVLPFKVDDLVELDDDFSSIENKKLVNKKVSTQDSTALDFKSEHNMNYQTDSPKTEVFEGIFLSKDELDSCISIKGSLEAVKHAIEYIMRSPGRKRKIYNWPNALSTWEIKTNIKPRLKENEEMAKRLEKEYGNSLGWRCEEYVDKKKDQKGILFYNSAATGNSEPIFISVIDVEFKEKVSNILRDKKMQHGRISKS